MNLKVTYFPGPSKMTWDCKNMFCICWNYQACEFDEKEIKSTQAINGK